jgi:hypothetical protein
VQRKYYNKKQRFLKNIYSATFTEWPSIEQSPIYNNRINSSQIKTLPREIPLGNNQTTSPPKGVATAEV